MAVLYRGGLFFDGTEFYEQHALLVEGQKIKAFGNATEFQGFSGEIVDTSGMTITPGLIDCHVHLFYSAEDDPLAAAQKLDLSDNLLVALKNAQKTLEGGITTLRDCGGREYIERAVRDAINKGDFEGPTLRVAGKVICMTGGHGVPLAREADGIQDVIKAVREQLKENVDHIKLIATGGVMTEGVDPEDAHLTQAELKAAVDEAKRFNKPVACHAQAASGILNAVLAGVNSIEHGIYMDEECIKEMLAHGTYLVPTLCAVEGIKSSNAPDYMKEKIERIEKIHQKAIMAFYRAGGHIAMGTDAGTPGNLHGTNANELRAMLNLGMSLKDVLKSATQNAAALMNITDRGLLAEGAYADLLIANGDVRKDIRVLSDTQNHAFVVKEGRVIVNRPKDVKGYRRSA